jgi:hypothetical protein
MYVYLLIYIQNMKTDLLAQSDWKHQMEAHWPALKGSLAQVYKPCIRKDCPTCRRGDKHPAWILSFTQQGRRKVMYVPGALVPQIRQALQNGRYIEALLYQVGPELIRHYRQNVPKSTKSKLKS